MTRLNFTTDTQRKALARSGGDICSVTDCCRPARGNAVGQRLCSMHYQRWARIGTTSLPDNRKSRTGLCTVDGCKNKVQSRNDAYCATHFFRIKRGSKAGLGPIIKNCLRCETPLTTNQSKFCSAKCRERTRNAIPDFRNCKACGKPFETNRKWEVCSDECRVTWTQAWLKAERTIEMKKMRGSRRRAILRGVQYEDFYHTEIYTRDKWICQICLTPVDRTKKPPNYRSPSIDHIVPLCKGGPHRRSNVQCAHWICNLRKSKLPMRRLDPPA